jgi:hypothetical protein
MNLGSEPSHEHGTSQFDDSDEESDKLDARRKRKPTVSQAFADPGNFKKIEILDNAYTTYLNLLCWIGSGYLEFATLRSTKLYPSPPLSVESRTIQPKPSALLPLPTSPKSLYRLAHLLELPELQQMARENFASQLTPQNIAYELYTDTASAYPGLRDIALAHAVGNWKEVVESKAFEELEKKAESETGIDGTTGLLLSKKLMEKWWK